MQHLTTVQEQQLREMIEQKYMARKSEIETINPPLFAEAENKDLDEELRFLLHYYCAYMSEVDLVNLSPEILLDFAKESIATRYYAYPEGLPFDMWLNFVAWYRVNTEEIVKHRAFFKEKIKDLVDPKDLVQTALNINIWCAEEGTYEGTDARTMNPMAFFNRVYGRCGEESTFLVSVLRSVGIAARQIYVPWWSHSDDNHAWVEVFTGEEFQFLGACEPEPILNRGWFTEAASRALLVISRATLPSLNEPMLPSKDIESLINRTPFYANTYDLSIQVQESGIPVSHATVTLEVMNTAGLLSLASLETDANGYLSMPVGLGSLRIHVQHQGKSFAKLINTAEMHQTTAAPLIIDFSQMSENEADLEKIEQFWFAPETNSPHHRLLTEEEKAYRTKIIEESTAKRTVKLERLAYMHEIDKLLSDFSALTDIKSSIVQARTNFPIIDEFMRNASADGLAEEASQILHAISLKDFADIRFSVLDSYLRLARPLAWVKEKSPEILGDSNLQKHLYSPRIGIEVLYPFYEKIANVVDTDKRDNLFENPQAIKTMIQNHFTADSGTSNIRYPAYLTTLWDKKLASFREKEWFCVALARYVGLPSYFSDLQERALYYKNEDWHYFTDLEESAPTSSITLLADDSAPTKLYYEGNWSLERYSEEKQFFYTVPVHELGDIESSPLQLHLIDGQYRIHTVKRLPNGNQMSMTQLFSMPQQENDGISLSWPVATPESLLSHYKLDPISYQVIDENGNSGNLRPDFCSDLDSSAALLLWLHPNEEPSVHVLAEMKEHKDQIMRQGLPIYFAIDSIEDLTPAYQALLEELKTANVIISKAEEPLARQIYVDPEKFPRMLLVTNEGICTFANAGYQVGLIHQILELLPLIDDNKH